MCIHVVVESTAPLLVRVVLGELLVMTEPIGKRHVLFWGIRGLHRGASLATLHPVAAVMRMTRLLIWV